jgi:uncharacterized membrane protein YraQ (UPF0718 family)
MNNWILRRIQDVFGITAFVILFIFLGSFLGNESNYNIPKSVLDMNTIFLSILVEALPFVLIGVFIAGIIQIFVTEDHVRRWIPANPVKATLMGCLIGALFPACECGIVPIVRRLIGKGVPVYAATAFMLTGPLINPVVALSTFMAFGNDAAIMMWRMILGFVAAMIVGLGTIYFFRGYASNQILKHSASSFSETAAGTQTVTPFPNPIPKKPLTIRFAQMFSHAIDEFFDMGKYLIIGAFLAAAVQTYVSTATLASIGGGLISGALVMMGLAFLLSLCSEADAFIAASFRHSFTVPSLLAFLVYGPMIDLKNTLMLMGAFRMRYVIYLLITVTVTVFAAVMAVSLFV